MPLVTIDDLLKHPNEELEPYLDDARRLSDTYDRWLEDDIGDGISRKAGIHASEASSCARKAVYALRAEPREGRNRKFWRQRFEAGKAMHSWLQRDFGRMAEASGGTLLFEPEAVISPEKQSLATFWNIQSSCDGIFTFRRQVGMSAGEAEWETVLRVGLEIKTEAPDGYEKLTGPKPDHIEQAHVYMACLDLPLMWFFYLNKANQNNTPSTGPWLIRFDDQLWHRMEQRFQAAHQHVNTGTMPERTEGIWCEFCAFRQICKPPYLIRKAAPRPSIRVPGRT
jgi:hypothetical protein